jgi:hypothetical protein
VDHIATGDSDNATSHLLRRAWVTDDDYTRTAIGSSVKRAQISPATTTATTTGICSAWTSSYSSATTSTATA